MFFFVFQVNHATGSASWQPGWLEVMVDRRTLYDDSRGMGEGVVDNKRTVHKHFLLVEDIAEDEGYSSPSLLANHLSLSECFNLSIRPTMKILYISVQFECSIRANNQFIETHGFNVTFWFKQVSITQRTFSFWRARWTKLRQKLQSEICTVRSVFNT